ncbi:hypothetical protein CYMTET_32593, partial [Cymbomonas tetramitiformis]
RAPGTAHQRFEGNWVNGQRDGYGHSYSGGESYQGFWKRGLPEGDGTLTYRNGDKLDGIFENGHAQGRCHLDMVGGDRFTGNFIAGIKHGTASVVTADGEVWEEIWENAALISRRRL